MTGLIKKVKLGGRHKWRWAKMEAVHLQAKEHQRSPANHQNLGAWNSFSLTVLTGSNPTNMLMSDFQPALLWDGKSCYWSHQLLELSEGSRTEQTHLELALTQKHLLCSFRPTVWLLGRLPSFPPAPVAPWYPSLPEITGASLKPGTPNQRCRSAVMFRNG